MSLRQISLEQSAVHKFVGSVANIQFQVSTDPTLTKAKVYGTSLAPSNYSFLATALRVGERDVKFKLRVPIRVMAQSSRVLNLLPGQLVSAKGSLQKSREARVAALLIIRGNITIETPPSRWASALGSIRKHLRELCGQGDAGALIPGMVLGDTSLQTPELKDAMRRSGLTHLVAVSGANFAIISFFVLWCMQWVFKSLRMRMIVTAIALSAFIALVRPSPSVLRAAAMASVVLFARGVGKRSDALPALGFAIAAVVVGDPWQARDPGFALSVLATAGLLLLAPRIAAALGKFVPPWFAGALSPPIAAVLMCAPILIALSGYIGPMTVIANLLVAPMVAPITIIGFVAALVSPVAPAVSGALLLLIRVPAGWITGVAHWAANFPVIQMTTGLGGFLAGLVFLCVLGLLFFLIKKTRPFFIILIVLLIIGLTWITRWPGGDWQLANCDVGQGDSLVINLGNHRALVIDTGPDAQLADRCLSRLGIENIPVLVLTHFHADHVEGLAGLVRNRSIGQVWVSNNRDPLFESARVKGWLAETSTVVATRGAVFSMQSARGPILIKVLWPANGEGTLGEGEGPAINNSSVVLEIRTPDFSLLAPGDVEPEAQGQILDSISHVDIYKVSHHGSGHQLPAFMAKLSPNISIISVGAENTYGHPAGQTLAALTRLGSRIYRTDKNGAIAIVARSHRLKVRTSAGAWWQKVRLG